MSLGVHFALTAEDVQRLLEIADPDELQGHIEDAIEGTFWSNHARWVMETDKAWNGIHRCLTDGRLLYEEGPFPLAWAILGGQCLDVGDDYTACLTDPKQVVAASKAMAALTEAWFRARYETLKSTEYAAEMSEEDFGYIWENFRDLRGWFSEVAKASRWVLFTTDC